MKNLWRRVKKIIKANLALDKNPTVGIEEMEGIRKKKYDNYEAYAEHQAVKLERVYDDISRNDLEYEKIVYGRYGEIFTCYEFAAKSMICLGARLGGEVRAFKNLGMLAVGIDLNPGKNSKHVLVGDFHGLNFPDAVFDFAFTNAFDHIYEPERFSAEVARVLKPNGKLIIEYTKTNIDRPSYEVIEIKGREDVEKLLANFSLEKALPLENKTEYISWVGEVLIFTKKY